MASEPLSPADRASLAAERGPVNMNVGAALVFDAGPGLEYAAMLERLASRLHLVPRFRQRLEESPSGLANPVWIDDVHFNLAWHVRTGVLPPPGGPAELGAYVATEMSRRMDRTRPLWEMHIVTGLADGRVAIVPKLHHAMVDGIAAIAIGTLILDPTPEPLEVPPADADWTPREYDRGEHLARIARAPFRSAHELALLASTRALYTTPRAAALDVRRATELVTQLAKTRPQAPMTPLNEPISPNRAFAMEHVPLASIKASAKLADATVNDVLLTIVAGMLRRYLDEADALPEGADPVALVPVSVRSGADGDGGNQISTVFVDLPASQDDPIARLGAIAAETRALKGSAAVRAGALMVGATGVAPPAMSAMLVRAMGGVRAFNVVVSNVPGPQFPLYLGGSQMREIYPVVPLNPGNQGLSVGILSYDGEVFVGLLADGALDPSVDRAAAALRASLAEMLELATV